jgi:capsid protein
MKFFRTIAIATLIGIQAGIARITNRYEGAVTSSGRSYVPEASPQSARFDASAAARTEIVRKARYFEKNSGLFNRLADLFECYTVGSCLQITPTSSDPEWNKKAKEEFDAWARRCDFSGRLTLSGIFGLGSRTWFVDGEAFILKTRLEPRRISSEPRIQLFEGHLVATPPSLAHLEGNTIQDGFTLDGAGRPIGCYIASEDARGQKIWGDPRPIKSIIHLGESSRAGMLRPFPFVYPVINLLHDLDDLQILAMRAAKEQARHINAVYNQAAELTPDQVRTASFSQAKTISTGATVSEVRKQYYQEGFGGETVVMHTGDKVERLGLDRHGVIEREAHKDLKAEVCTGIGIPYVLAYPESMQGTVFRGALDMADAFFAARFETIKAAALDVYEFYMEWARYNVKRLQDAPADWKAATVHQPRSVNVDVGRNSTAMLQQLQAGACTYEEVYGPQGKNWKERFDRLKEMQAYADQIGLKIIFPGQPAAPAEGPTKPSPELEEDLETQPGKAPAK